MAVEDQTDEMFAGNKRVLCFTLTDVDGGGALNLSSRIVKFAMTNFTGSGKPDTEDPFVDINSVTSPDIVITAPATAGLVEVTLQPTDTAPVGDDQRVGDFYCELEVFDAGDTIPVVVATITMTVKANVVNA